MSEKERCNVYDFDGTIYDGDSMQDFCKFCLRRQPLLIFSMGIPMFFGALFALGLVSRKRLKEQFYMALLPRIDDAGAALSAFWIAHAQKIKPWYLEQKKPTDIIVSASPEFLLGPICEQIGVILIASKVDLRTGRLLGANCRGEEKVRRFRAACADLHIAEFYTDTASDAPLAAMAEKAYVVHGENISDFAAFIVEGKKLARLKHIAFRN